MTIETKVKKVIAEKIPDVDIDDVVPEASLIEDLGADSLTIVELVMSMEERFFSENLQKTMKYMHTCLP